MSFAFLSFKALKAWFKPHVYLPVLIIRANYNCVDSCDLL